MKKILMLLCSLILLFVVYCDVKTVYETEYEIIGDTYLPNIHLKQFILEDLVELDTLFVKSNDAALLRVEIGFDNKEYFKEMTLEYMVDLLHYEGGFGCSIDRNYLTDMTLDSLSDKIIIHETLTPRDHKLFTYQAIIYEPDYPAYDLMRYKEIIIANPDSLLYLVLTYADNGQEIEVNLETKIIIELPSNQSTGYGWEFANPDDNFIYQDGESVYIITEGPGMGAGGIERFIFRASRTGNSSIRLVYRRPWEEVEPLDEFHIDVIVR